jgi:hypothetical protein
VGAYLALVNSKLGVTRWLVAPRALVAQTGLVVLLLGVIVGQNVARFWPVLADRPAAEPARPAAAPFEPAPAPTAANAAEPVRGAPPAPGLAPVREPVLAPVREPESRAVEPPPAPARREPATPAPTLTRTERWITTSSHDATRRGYSVWLVLRPGGNLVVERCRAPDWSAPPGSVPAPRCEVVLDQVIAAVDGSRVDLRNGRSFHFSLGSRDGEELLRLSLAEELELVPGSRSTLVAHLGYLPGDGAARARWARVARGQRLARVVK